MEDGFIAKPLGRRQIDQAFPLVRAIAPELLVERWREFAAGAIASAGAPSGIMTIQNVRGYIHGLFSYSAEDHLRHGRVLAVENFVVLDLFDVAGATEALLRAMDAVARALGCTAIHTTLPDAYASMPNHGGSVLNVFRHEGHAVETLRLCKPLDGANDNHARPVAITEEAD